MKNEIEMKKIKFVQKFNLKKTTKELNELRK